MRQTPPQPAFSNIIMMATLEMIKSK